METRKFLHPGAIDLLLLRVFESFGGRISFEHFQSPMEGKRVKSVIINAGDFETVIINGKYDCGRLRGIIIFWTEGLIELSYINLESQELLLEYLPLDGIYQLIFRQKIKPQRNDHHGNEDD